MVPHLWCVLAAECTIVWKVCTRSAASCFKFVCVSATSVSAVGLAGCGLHCMSCQVLPFDGYLIRVAEGLLGLKSDYPSYA